jgi:hypothetical protein
MRSRTRLIAAAVITAALAAGSAGAAVASTTGTKPAAPPNTVSASKKPAAGRGAPGEPGGSKGAGAKAAAKGAARPGTDPFPAAVAGVLHVSTARANTALRPLLTAGMVDPSSREFAAAARSLGVSPQQLSAALAQAKQSLAAGK